MEQITIQGFEFTVPAPYTAGHTLTEGEASALNGLLHENLRNNFAAKVKKAKEEAGEDGEVNLGALQDELSEYADTYEFGVRRPGGGGGVRLDPVTSEALKLAKTAIYDALKKQGKARKDYTNEQITAAAMKLLESEKGEQFKAVARERVEAAQSIAQITLEGI